MQLSVFQGRSHGDPIPDANLAIVAQPARTVAQLAPGESAVVARIPTDPELVRYLVELSLAPGDVVALKEIGPFAPCDDRNAQRAACDRTRARAAVEVT